MNLRRILNCFGLMSGLRINYGKSTITPLNCGDSLIQEINSSLGCTVVTLATRYLGIASGDNSNRVETWSPIIEKIKQKLSGWKGKLLLRVERLTLIKSVLNNLPIYYLGLFKMPKQVAKKIISLQSIFFRG